MKKLGFLIALFFALLFSYNQKERIQEIPDFSTDKYSTLIHTRHHKRTLTYDSTERLPVWRSDNDTSVDASWATDTVINWNSTDWTPTITSSTSSSALDCEFNSTTASFACLGSTIYNNVAHDNVQ